MGAWHWLVDWARDDFAVPADSAIRQPSAADPQAIRLDCGHCSASYATYPQTGVRVCLDCYHAHLVATLG